MKKKSAAPAKQSTKLKNWKRKSLLGILIAAVGLGALSQVPSKHLPSVLQKPKSVVEKQVSETQNRAHKLRLSLAPQPPQKAQSKAQKNRATQLTSQKKMSKATAKKSSVKQKKLAKSGHSQKSQKALVAKAKAKNKSTQKSHKSSLAMQAR